MNVHFFSALSLFLSLVGTVTAQQSVAPQNPVLPRAPALASWTMTYKYKADDAKPPSVTNLPADLIRSVTVTKTHKIYWEQITLVSGGKYEKWIFDDAELKTMPDSSSIILLTPPTIDSSEHDYSDYRKSDFPELSWVSSRNYTGLKTQSGKTGYHFEMGTRIALLSTENQLPLYSVDDNVERTYTYNSPPTAPLIIPKKFLDVLQTHRRAVEALKYHPIPM